MDHEWHPGWHPILLAISWYQIPIFFSQVFTPGKPFGVEQHPGYVPIFLQQTHTQFTFKSSSFIKICRPIFKCITHICICIYIYVYIYMGYMYCYYHCIIVQFPIYRYFWKIFTIAGELAEPAPAAAPWSLNPTPPPPAPDLPGSCTVNVFFHDCHQDE